MWSMWICSSLSAVAPSTKYTDAVAPSVIEHHAEAVAPSVVEHHAEAVAPPAMYTDTVAYGAVAPPVIEHHAEAVALPAKAQHAPSAMWHMNIESRKAENLNDRRNWV